MSTAEDILLTGVVIAIPVGIVTNLLTTPVQHRVDKALKRSGDKWEATRVVYARQVALFVADNTQFHIYLTEQILRTTVFTALFGLISGLAFAAGQGVALIHIFVFDIINVLDLIGQLAALIGTLTVFTIARNALRTVISVRSMRKASETDRHAVHEE